MSIMVLQGPKYSPQKSRPLESGHRRHGVCIAIECSYKLDQKNEFKFLCELCTFSQIRSHIMLWVACCIAFFGFMQIDEFTVPGPDNYDESSHLSFADISVDSHENPCLVTIKQSKTDPFHKGISTYTVKKLWVK